MIIVLRGTLEATVGNEKRTLGYSEEDAASGGIGYVPISLKYRPYTAEHAREHSIAGDPRASDVLDRAYRGKTVTTHNESDS
ncbi:hypothetical protein J2T14_004391 [Paenibacillus harenae]|nr:hypothetical protein [Paenibacillus harenae]